MKAVVALGIACIAVALTNADEGPRQGFFVPVQQPQQQFIAAPQSQLPVLGGNSQQQQQQQLFRTIMLLFILRRLRDDDDDDDDDDDCDLDPWYKARNGCYYRRFFSPLRTYDEGKAYCPTQCKSTIAVKGMRDDFVIKTEILNAVNFDDTSPGVWIGLRETSTTDVWQWDDGVPSTVYDATASPNGNTNWDRVSPAQPVAAGTTDCARVAHDDAVANAEFSVSTCGTDHAVLCELCM